VVTGDRIAQRMEELRTTASCEGFPGQLLRKFRQRKAKSAFPMREQADFAKVQPSLLASWRLGQLVVVLYCDQGNNVLAAFSKR
jgi:hypothetical protein